MGVRNGDELLYRTLQDKAGMLTPNITTLYAFSFWDLAAQGPLVVEVPAGLTAGGVLDIWQQPITDMGQTGPDKAVAEALYASQQTGSDGKALDGRRRWVLRFPAGPAASREGVLVDHDVHPAAAPAGGQSDRSLFDRG
jgi:hypothetical protein